MERRDTLGVLISTVPPCRVLGLLAAVLLFPGCAAEGPLQLAPRITVVNRTTLVIAEVRYRSCGASTELWHHLELAPLQPESSAVTDFPLPCADLSAQYADGRTAGSQSGVKQQFPFRWDIY